MNLSDLINVIETLDDQAGGDYLPLSDLAAYAPAYRDALRDSLLCVAEW